MNKHNQKKNRNWIILVILLGLLAAVLIWALRPADPASDPVLQPGSPSAPESQPTAQSTEPALFPLELAEDLVVTDAGNYSGIFMEDGSNEVVSDVFMLQVENRSDQDLQYGEIILTDEAGSYRFQVTNLPAHRQAVLLEQGRSAAPDAFPRDASARNLAWFREPMSLHEEQFSVTGAKGVVNVKNISEQDVDADVYVYYKYTADSLFFGGITFRVRVEGGLKAGEIRQVPSGHFDPESCTVLDVTIHGE